MFETITLSNEICAQRLFTKALTTMPQLISPSHYPGVGEINSYTPYGGKLLFDRKPFLVGPTARLNDRCGIYQRDVSSKESCLSKTGIYNLIQKRELPRMEVITGGDEMFENFIKKEMLEILQAGYHIHGGEIVLFHFMKSSLFFYTHPEDFSLRLEVSGDTIDKFDPSQKLTGWWEDLKKKAKSA